MPWEEAGVEGPFFHFLDPQVLLSPPSWGWLGDTSCVEDSTYTKTSGNLTNSPTPALGPLIGRGRSSDVHLWGENHVIKLFHSGQQREHVELEAHIQRTAHRAGVSCPAVVQIVNVGGRHGIVFEHAQGASMLDALIEKPWRLDLLARQAATVHAEMHDASARALPDQRGKLERSIHRAPALSGLQREAALKALERLPGGDSLCHGDFHPDNVLVGPKGLAVVDWRTGASGNPVADVVRTALNIRNGSLAQGRFAAKHWFFAAGRKLFCHRYLMHYRRIRAYDLGEFEAWCLPIAAARLGADIPGERSVLLAIIDNAMRSA